ncbi:MAG: cytochrome c oxidase subunit I, partial [Burkholderiales bacterium]|nr:cytochrome c oxidase subunit I [Burkholderiales bacterium]
MTTASDTLHAHDHAHEEHHVSFVQRWFYATNHKDIGTLYLWFAFSMFITGGIMALCIRAELFQPGL